MTQESKTTAKKTATANAPTLLTGQATDEQIAAWKKKHESIWAYEADGRIGYLKKADRTVISAATTLSTTNGQVDNYKFAEVIITNCWLGGDDTLRTEDKYFIGLANKVGGIVEVVTGEIKKL